MSKATEQDIVKAAVDAQTKYCRTNKLPMFIPHNGICFRCGRNIFTDGGIPPEKAGATLITGCPLCNASFCD